MGTGGAARTPGSHHGTAFATCCNGFDEAKRQRLTGTFVASKRRIAGVRVVKIWDPVREAAEKLAEVCGVSRLVSHLL